MTALGRGPGSAEDPVLVRVRWADVRRRGGGGNSAESNWHAAARCPDVAPMTADTGVPDSVYSTLVERFLSGTLTAQAFRSQFYSTLASDARLSDEVRYAILQRVFFGLEDLILDADLPAGEEREEDEIDEAAFRVILERAAHDLAHRPDDWEGAHGSGTCQS